MTVSRAGAHVENLKISVTIHADKVPAVVRQEQDVNRTIHVERCALFVGVDPRLGKPSENPGMTFLEGATTGEG